MAPDVLGEMSISGPLGVESGEVGLVLSIRYTASGSGVVTGDPRVAAGAGLHSVYAGEAPPPLAEARIAESESEKRSLEAALERAEHALAAQQFSILAGYVVTVWPVGDGTHIASCPTLHASVQEDNVDGALESLREAACVVREAHERSGRPLPAKDVDARWLDWLP